MIALFAALVAGCGGEKTVAPTADTVEGTPPPAPQPQAKGDAAAGKQVFAQSGCGGCHTFKAAGTNGKIGPDLDEALQGKDAAFVRESIVDPNAEIASGFQPNVMPQNYGEQLDSQQIADLVAFLTAK